MRERVLASDPAAGTTGDSATLFAEFHRRLHAVVSRRMRNRADAEDVVQETFLRLHRHLPGVRRTDRLAAWIFQVARNAIADHYRRERHSERVDQERARDTAAAVSDKAGALQELASCLAPMLESLPPADRQAIQLSEFEGLTQREASTRAGMTLSGMKSRVQRARRKLKALLVDCCRIELDRRGGIIGEDLCGKPCGPAARRTRC